jgi:hypothetical protein
MMFLLDPDLGRRRRALIRNKMVRARNQARWFLERQLRNAIYNLQGTVAETRAKLREAPVSDEVLEERVRAQVGHVVSHPGSLEVVCRLGHVTIRGPVLAGERQRISDRLSETRGVRSFTLELREQQEAGSTPGLQGESHGQREQRIG